MSSWTGESVSSGLACLHHADRFAPRHRTSRPSANDHSRRDAKFGTNQQGPDLAALIDATSRLLLTCDADQVKAAHEKREWWLSGSL